MPAGPNGPPPLPPARPGGPGLSRRGSWTPRHADFCRHCEAAIAPSLQTASKRPHVLQSPATKRQRNARAGVFTRTSTVDDDLTIGRFLQLAHCPFVPLNMTWIDSYSAGNAHEFLNRLLVPLYIQN